MELEDLYDDVQFAEIADQQISYVSYGSGTEVIVFLHGMASNLKAWQKNIDVLKADYRCIALDLPGYGRSSRMSSAFDLEKVAKLVIQFISHMKLENVTLVGHSMGGQLSLLIAHQQPALVARMILVAPAGLEQFSQGEVELIKTYFTGEFIASYSKQMITKNFELNFYEMPDDARFMISDRHQLCRDTEKYLAFCHTVSQSTYSIITSNVMPLLSKLKQPVLVLFGEDDKLIPHHIVHPERTTREIAEAGVAELQKGKLILFEKCGHYVQWEKWEEVNRAIMGWMEKNRESI